MGQNQSSEANGVRCVECGEGLPANNWNFAHSGQHGWVYAFYAEVSDRVRVVKSDALGGEIHSNNSGSFGVKMENTEERTNVRVLQYIRNKTKSNGYTCLRCLYICCRNGYPGWNRIEHELNRVMISNGIYVKTIQAFSHDRSVAYMTVSRQD